MNRLSARCLALAALALMHLISPFAAASNAVWVHWPMPSYVEFLRDHAGDTLRTDSSRVALAFPMLLVFTGTGSLAWTGDPKQFSAEPQSVESWASNENQLAAVLSVLDRARVVFPDIGFEQVEGLPSAHVVDGRPTAVIVFGAINCDSCDAAVQAARSRVPKEWNILLASVVAY